MGQTASRTSGRGGYRPVTDRDLHGHRGRGAEGTRDRGARGRGAGSEGHAATFSSPRHRHLRTPSASSAPSGLYADGKFNTPDGKATFAQTQWRGLQAAGKQAEKDKFAFLINNGRTNHVWQSAYLDVENELVMDRWPYPFIEMNPQDMAALNLKSGDLVEVYNDNGSDAGHGLSDADGEAEASLHAVRLPDTACRATSSQPA